MEGLGGTIARVWEAIVSHVLELTTKTQYKFGRFLATSVCHVLELITKARSRFQRFTEMIVHTCLS